MEKRVIEKEQFLKSKKGITLVALVITIIIIIILSTITINMAFGDNGLIKQAELAKDMAANSTTSELEDMNSLLSEYANLMAEDSEITGPGENTETGGNTEIGGGTEPEEPGNPDMDDAKPNPGQDGPEFPDTTTIKDDKGNDVVIPGGFHLDEDSGTKVEDGIVIEDSNGNQFVWIPVGTYNVTEDIDNDGTKDGKLTNNLSRRTFTSTEATEVDGDSGISDGSKYYYYGEGYSSSTVAYTTIGAFKTSATANGGFYIGRYEQSYGNVCKEGVSPYVSITRDGANTLAKEMYSGNSYVTSELISSYAWDTALNFICQTNSAGYTLATLESEGGSYWDMFDSATNTGVNVADNYSNIHDFLGNCIEWTTEYSNDNPCVCRGGILSRSCAAVKFTTVDTQLIATMIALLLIILSSPFEFNYISNKI